MVGCVLCDDGGSGRDLCERVWCGRGGGWAEGGGGYEEEEGDLGEE